MDRTVEFKRIIELRRTGSVARKPPTTRSEFAAATSKIGADIHSTAEKLGKLTQLAQSKSLFEDPTREINDLTLIIKQDIQNLNAALAEQQQAMRQHRSGAKQQTSHSTNVVDALKSHLRDTTKGFQEVLHERSNNMKELQTRREEFGAGPSSSSGGASMGGASSSGVFHYKAPPAIFECGPLGQAAGSSALAVPSAFGAGAFDSGATFGSSSMADAASPPGGGQLVIDMPQDTSGYMDMRAKAARDIQSTIAELGGIFQELAVIVDEQGQMLQRVDENVDTTVTNVNQGQEQLMRYWKNMSGNKQLIVRVFSVLLFFIVLFGMFFA